MPLSSINNGDSGASARTKINAAIAALNVTTPKVVYVDAVNGNNATGEIGNPTKPFATFPAGYAAGVTTANAFCLHFAAGTYEYTPSDSEASFQYCVRMIGAGISLTTVTINGSRQPVVNQNGVHGYSMTQVQVDDLALTINAQGSGVEENDGLGPYLCGDGGDITLYGSGQIAIALCNGGSEISSTWPTVTPGSGGTITLRDLNCRSMSFSVAQGTGAGGAASDGELLLDGCDIRGTSNSGATTTVGRCSYDAALFTITNDKGGNAAY